MGFLDHTTNNIVIDAVLTERGRELLARNDGSFRIDAFAFGDDEVDYSNITKYGLNIGKEKIEKNTPIFEAQTNENLALKHNLISLSSSATRILYIPILVPYLGMSVNTSGQILPLELSLNTSNANVKNLSISILSTIPASANQTSIDSNLVDLQFEVKMNSLLMSLYSANNVPTENYTDLDENLVATYQVTATENNVSGTNLNSPNNYALINRQLLTLNLGITNNINSATFKKFGTLTQDGLSGSIDTYVEIIGLGSGSRLLVPFKITLN